MDIRDYTGTGQGIDLSDTVLHECVCGGRAFRLVVTFDNYEIATYSTDMECLECNTRCKAPTPIDRPTYWSDI